MQIRICISTANFGLSKENLMQVAANFDANKPSKFLNEIL